MREESARSKQKPKAIDLFSGCGGLTVGLKKAGFDVVGAVELDPLASETYVSNHPTVRLWMQDIKTLDPLVVMHELDLVPGQLDLLAGCPPCQGFSSIRTLNGGRSIVDERNDLIAEFSRFVREFRPKAIMFENVPALAKDTRMAVFRAVLNVGEMADNCQAKAHNVYCVLPDGHEQPHVWRNVNCQHTEEDERAGLCEHDHDPVGALPV